MCALDSPVRGIFGAELTVQTSPTGRGARHLTLLVRDRGGWRNLCRLLTLAHAHTRERPDRRASDPIVCLEDVLQHAEGLVCLTGCAEHGVHDEPTCRRLLDAFGPESLRVELQRPYMQGDRARNRMLDRLARRLGVRPWRAAACTRTPRCEPGCRTRSSPPATARASTPANWSCDPTTRTSSQGPR